MKRILVLFLVTLSLSYSISCSKGSDDDGCSETGLQFTSNPAVNSNQTPAPGPDFPLQINITQPLPSQGVNITVTAKPENPANAQPFFNQTKSSTTAANEFNITGTPAGVVAVVEITVTSKSCNTNKASGTYKYSRK